MTTPEHLYKSHLLRQNESFKSQGDDFKLKHKSLEKSKNHLESSRPVAELRKQNKSLVVSHDDDKQNITVIGDERLLNYSVYIGN